MPVDLTECSRLFQELEMQRIVLLAQLAGWSSGRLSFRPEPGVWSTVEVLDHIVRAETGTIAGVRAGLQNPHMLGGEDRPGIAALDRALRSEQRFKVPPAAQSIHPDAQTSLPEVASRWQHTRAEMGSLLETLTPDDMHRGVFRHPFAGWMTMAEVLNHLSAHLYHHEFQLERLRVISAIHLAVRAGH
jgi:hypothetical protein